MKSRSIKPDSLSLRRSETDGLYTMHCDGDEVRLSLSHDNTIVETQDIKMFFYRNRKLN